VNDPAGKAFQFDEDILRHPSWIVVRGATGIVIEPQGVP
jgi:hypothetical protein